MPTPPANANATEAASLVATSEPALPTDQPVLPLSNLESLPLSLYPALNQAISQRYSAYSNTGSVELEMFVTDKSQTTTLAALNATYTAGGYREVRGQPVAGQTATLVAYVKPGWPDKLLVVTPIPGDPAAISAALQALASDLPSIRYSTEELRQRLQGKQTLLTIISGADLAKNVLEAK